MQLPWCGVAAGWCGADPGRSSRGSPPPPPPPKSAAAITRRLFLASAAAAAGGVAGRVARPGVVHGGDLGFGGATRRSGERSRVSPVWVSPRFGWCGAGGVGFGGGSGGSRNREREGLIFLNGKGFGLAFLVFGTPRQAVSSLTV